MNILFIGGSGNISTECAEALRTRGHDVSIVTRGRTPIAPHFKSFTADRHDSQAMHAVVKQAKPGVVLDYIAFDVPDVQSDFDLCQGVVGQYIFISSATVYIRPAPSLPYTEESPLGNPAWDYAQKKLACESWLRERWEQDRFPVTIVRPAHTYSRRWIPNVVSSSTFSVAARFLAGKPLFVPDDGEIPWTLTAASDFAQGLAGLVGNPGALGEAFHITGDEVLTWNQIYDEIADALGARDPQVLKIPTDFICHAAPQLTGNLKGDKAHPGIYDNSKLKRFVPEFHPRIPFKEGVRQSAEWLLAHPEHQNLNPDIDRTIDRITDAWRAHRTAPTPSQSAAQ